MPELAISRRDCGAVVATVAIVAMVAILRGCYCWHAVFSSSTSFYRLYDYPLLVFCSKVCRLFVLTSF